MKCIIKYSGAHRGNSIQQIPGAKIIIYFPSAESTRLKTAHLIVFLSSGQVRDASQSYLLDRKHRKKEKKSLNLQSGWVWWQMWWAGGIWHFLLSDFACVEAKSPESGPLSEQVKLCFTT